MPNRRPFDDEACDRITGSLGIYQPNHMDRLLIRAGAKAAMEMAEQIAAQHEHAGDQHLGSGPMSGSQAVIADARDLEARCVRDAIRTLRAQIDGEGR